MGQRNKYKSDFYYDKYFNQQSNSDNDILWTVIYNGNYNTIKDITLDNVIFIIEEKKKSLFRKDTEILVNQNEEMLK